MNKKEYAKGVPNQLPQTEKRREAFMLALDNLIRTANIERLSLLHSSVNGQDALIAAKRLRSLVDALQTHANFILRAEEKTFNICFNKQRDENHAE